MSIISPQSAEASETASLEKIAATALDLAWEIRSATECDDATLSHYIQALGIYFENADGPVDIEGLSRMLRDEIALIRAHDEGDEEAIARIESSMEFVPVAAPSSRDDHNETKWEVDTPEEAHILCDLLRNRVEIKGSSQNYRNRDRVDTIPEAPRCAKILYVVSDKVFPGDDLESGLDFMTRYIEQFNEIYQAYVAVAEKYQLELVRSEEEWIASLDAEELANVATPPVDLSHALEDFEPYPVVYYLFWEIQKAPNEEIEGKIRRFLSEIPDAFFVEERAMISEVDSIEPERADFERWLMEKALKGVFRKEVMAEIDRRWPSSEVARRVARTTLERLDNQGLLARSKKQGKLHFTRST